MQTSEAGGWKGSEAALLAAQAAAAPLGLAGRPAAAAIGIEAEREVGWRAGGTRAAPLLRLVHPQPPSRQFEVVELLDGRLGLLLGGELHEGESARPAGGAIDGQIDIDDRSGD